MGERQGWLLEPTFNRSVKLRQAHTRVSYNAGAILLREVGQPERMKATGMVRADRQ